MLTFKRHCAPQINNAPSIQVKLFDSNAACRCQSEEQGVVGIPGEVLRPFVFARMIEGRPLSGCIVERPSRGVLCAVTALAG